VENLISNLHNKLTSNLTHSDTKSHVLNFAKELGWNPSYFIPASNNEKANGYLVVEHGLQNSAIISFLNVRNEDLTRSEEENLLALSYNNLVNWHITIDEKYVNYYYILNKEKRKLETLKIEVGNESESLRVETFLEIIQKKPNSNIKALDDILIENISNWKRFISSELNNEVDLVSLSNLFNSIIFLRSIEDSKKRFNELEQTQKTFLNIISDNSELTFSGIIKQAEDLLIAIPDYIVKKENLKVFDTLQIQDLRRMFNSFYENEYNRFRYDFSIMTKQALSRIYQKYVSLLSIPNLESNAFNLFNIVDMPLEKINKEAGAYYTPEYIARFFSKYISKNYTDKEFDELNILEPAVGSGIFLRTLLETEIEQRIDRNSEIDINKLFNNVIGIDIDLNACLATNLSLTLLQYTFNKNLIEPKIYNEDSIKTMQLFLEDENHFDVIISNPPYINQNNKDTAFVDALKSVLNNLTNGKIDAYQGFLKLSIDLLKPDGIGLFVLPHNFLISESSKHLRNYLLKHCYIEVVADLSAINVFENVSTYTALLIIRKKKNSDDSNNNFSWILKCKSSVGEGLSNLLSGNEVENSHYQVYKAKDYFKQNNEWFILNKSELDLFQKIKTNREINDFLKVSQGIVTGKDDVFIRDKSEINPKEKSIYKNFLPDKKISSYLSDYKEDLILFPFINEKHIEEEVFSVKFEKTWEYLNSKKNILEERSKVKNNNFTWWKIHSTGNPVDINSPKIVCPYMSITPKFSIDIKGDYITSRSPYFTLKDNSNNFDLLYYFLGILNSIPCYWSLSLQSHKQSKGYNIFPISLLKTTSIPDPTLQENSLLVNKMILLVKKRINEKDISNHFNLEMQINELSCELYKLNQDEKELLGIF